MGIRRPGLRSGIAVALAASAALAGCTEKKPADATPSAPGSSGSSASAASSASSPSSTGGSAQAAPTTTAAPRTEKWINLQVGDCLADAPPSDPAVVEVTVVDCSQAHLAETFLRAPIPVDAALDGTANSECLTGLPHYTPNAGEYTITYMIDSDQDRTGNNPLPSTVICLLQGAGGQALTGSAARG